MFLFKKKEIEICDIHCHILPGLDDGSKSLEESLKMAETAYKSGVRRIVCTPHYKIYHSDNAKAEAIRSSLSLLQTELDRRNMGLKLHEGNELMAYKGMADDKKFLSLNNSGVVLVEFKPWTPYNEIYEGINDLRAAGYLVILAHCERYSDLVSEKERAYELKSEGNFLQINAASLISNNPDLTRFIRFLLDEELADFVSSDGHDNSERSCSFEAAKSFLYRHYPKPYVEALLSTNARELLNI